jgi:hypothetical protein
VESQNFLIFALKQPFQLKIHVPPLSEQLISILIIALDRLEKSALLTAMEPYKQNR